MWTASYLVAAFRVDARLGSVMAPDIVNLTTPFNTLNSKGALIH
jgi:hypothetical protein